MAIQTLVVDNNPVLLKAVSTLLEQEGCQVRVASNGLDALEILQDYYPDIVFTDLVMPLVGGDKLCKIIRKSPKLKNIFLVVLSAIVLEEGEKNLVNLDCDVCIAKGDLQGMRADLQEALSLFARQTRETGRILGRRRRGGESESDSVLGELLSEKYHLKEILENLSEGIIELNRDGKILSLNQAAVKILAGSMEDLIGLPFSSLDLHDSSGKVVSWLQDELRGNGGQSLEITDSDPIRIGGSLVSASFLPVREEDSLFAICILRDITREYKAERQKREFDKAMRLMKKMDAMSCMAGGVAHDFNNLLTVICGNLELINLVGDYANQAENVSLLENAKRAASVSVDLVRKISCFSPFGMISRQDVVIEDFVATVLGDFFKRNPGRCEFAGRTERHRISIDSEQIAIALNNVLQNAVEADVSGTIAVSITNEIVDAPSIRSGQYLPEGNFVRISVRDTGRGIESENMIRVFDPYFSTKQRSKIKGMGLGLTIVYSTLRNHGGYVTIQSERGKGTDVSLYLPFYESARDGDAESPALDLSRRRILLVEHDEQLRTIGKIMLEYLGIQTLTAENRVEAESAVKSGFADGRPPGMAILSLAGAEGNDGIEICRTLHQLVPTLKVVVSGGDLLEPAMIHYKKHGFVNILPNPYTLDDLRRVVSVL
ncbi:MAG: response regulator [Desulfocapsaceae bacterium]|nr:response regulator [Desulfocapsaceae bacterium]